jgi:hypothetical protein
LCTQGARWGRSKRERAELTLEGSEILKTDYFRDMRKL